MSAPEAVSRKIAVPPATDPHASENHDLAKGALINALGVLARVSKAIYMIAFSRLFGKDLFGLYLLSYAIVDVVAKIAAIGLDWGALRLVVRLRAQGNEDAIRPTVFRILGLGFLTSVVTAIGLAIVSRKVAISLLDKEELAKPLLLLCCALPAMTLTQVLLFAIRAARKMQYEVYVRSIVEPLVLLGAGFAAFAFHREIVGIILAQIIAALACFIAALVYFGRVYPKRSNTPKVSVPWGELIQYSFPMGGMDVLNIFKQRVDLMVVGRFLSIGAVGILGAVIEIANLIRKVRQAFDPISMPIITYLHEKNARERLQRHYIVAVRWIVVPSLVFLLTMFLLPQEYLIVFGGDFISGAAALRIFAIGQFFYVTLGLAENILAMTKHPYVNMFNSAALVALDLILLFWLVPSYGLVGAAVATMTSFVVVSAFRSIQAYYFIGVHPFEKSQLKPFVAGGIAYVISYAVLHSLGDNRVTNLFVVVPVFLSSYHFALARLGREPEDIEVWERLQRRMGRMFRRARPHPVE